MQGTLALFDTTIGKKAALAVSGLVLFGFVIVHMLGNLQVFLGAEVYNDYAATLKANVPLLWGVRVTLLVALIVHIAMMVQLYSRSLSARGVSYRKQASQAISYASATMQFTGPMVGLYIVFHIAHFTYPGLSLGDYEFSHTDAYSNFVQGFSIPWVTILYVVATLMLGLHLYHGAWSFLQSLGMSHPRYNRIRNGIAHGVAWGITLGNISMPIAVLMGWVPL